MLQALRVSKLTDAGAEVLFNKERAIVTKNGKFIMDGKRKGNLYIYDQVLMFEESKQHIDNTTLWHYRFGHSAIPNIIKLKKSNAAIGSDKININGQELEKVCASCMYGKAHRNGDHQHHEVSRILECVTLRCMGTISIYKCGWYCYTKVYRHYHRSIFWQEVCIHNETQKRSLQAK